METVKKITAKTVLPKIRSESLTLGILKFTLAFLLARILIFGSLSPFSLPFLMVFKGNIFVFFASVTGVLSNPLINPYKQVLTMFCTIILSLLTKTAFPKTDEQKIAPFVIFATSLIFNLIFIIFKEFTLYDIILCVFDAFISAVFYYILKTGALVIEKFKSRKLFTEAETAAFLILFALALSGIGSIYLPYGLQLGNIAGVYLVFLIAINTNLGFTAQASTLTGLAVGLSAENTGAFIATYSLCGLLSSVFKRYGKVALILGFVLGNTITGIFMAKENYLTISYAEIAIAGILMVLTPDKKIRKMFFHLINSSTEYDKANTVKEISASKLGKLSSAFRKLSETVNTEIDEVSKSENAINAIFDDTTDKFCKYCFLRGSCWVNDYETTAKVFVSSVEKIDQSGKITLKDLPDFFVKRCEKAEKIINNLQNLYEIYRLNEAWQYKIHERSNIFKEHFYDLGVIIDKLKDEITENPYFDNTISLELASEIEKSGIEVKDLTVIKDGDDNTQVEILLHSCNLRGKCFITIAEILEDYFDVPFERTGGHCGSRECRITFKECEIYRLSSSVKQISKNSGERCGDAYTFKALDNGSHFIALCDGSGSGNNAFNYAKATVRLLEDFLKTGFSKRSVLNLINATLLLGPDKDYFSTVDLFVVNLKNLNAEFVKKGAAATYILRENGEYDIIKGNSLPIGIAKTGREQVRKMRLSEGDLIVMASDGVVEAIDKEDWIIDAAQAAMVFSPDELAEIIIKIAQSAASDNKDDMTVIVTKIVQST